MRDLWQSIRRSPYQSLASFFSLLLTLFLSSVLILFLAFLYGLITHIESSPPVVAFFKTDAPADRIAAIHKSLLDSGKTRSIKLISKEEAFNIYTKRVKDKSVLTDTIDESIFPVSLNIFAKDPIYLKEIADYLNEQKEIDQVRLDNNVVSKLLNLTKNIRLISLCIVILLFCVSTLVMTTTILFKVSLKRDEFELLQLLGASNFYIQKPFYWESLFFAFLASTLSFGLIVGLLWQFQHHLASYLQGIDNLVVKFANMSISIWPINPVVLLGVYGASMAYGCLMGLIATFIATRKYLS